MPPIASAARTNEMSNQPIYEMLAQAFASEGVDCVQSDGPCNMHWATAMSKSTACRCTTPGMGHCACGMAMGYLQRHRQARVASLARTRRHPNQHCTLHGHASARPAGGVRRRKPDQCQVVQPGDRPGADRQRNRRPLRARAQRPADAEYVREALDVACYERRPTRAVPYDLQRLGLARAGLDYKSSASFIPQPGRTPPNPTPSPSWPTRSPAPNARPSSPVSRRRAVSVRRRRSASAGGSQRRAASDHPALGAACSTPAPIPWASPAALPARWRANCGRGADLGDRGSGLQRPITPSTVARCFRRPMSCRSTSARWVARWHASRRHVR